MEFYIITIQKTEKGGCVKLLGRTRDEIAACIFVENIPRVSYVLARNDANTCNRSYAFAPRENITPRGTHEYNIYKTSYNEPINYGMVTPFAENPIAQFLVSRKIRGPSWIVVANPENVSDHVFKVLSPKQIFSEDVAMLSDITPPLLRLGELAINYNDGKIQSIAFRAKSATVYTCEYPTNSTDTWKIIHMPSEYSIISASIRDMLKSDLDMLFGYDVKQTMITMQNRYNAVNCTVPFDWRKDVLYCDLKILASEMSSTHKIKTVALRDIADAVLSDEPKTVFDTIELLTRVELSRKIGDKTGIVELTRCLSRLAGTPWSLSLECKRIQRIEWLFDHEFGGLRKFIVPDPVSYKEFDSNLPTTYDGGLNLEPVRGLHSGPIALLDFKSLYPSIMCEYDLCFIGYGTGKGIIPKIMQKFIEMRNFERKVQPQTTQSENKQKALKLLMNSIYGCIGCRWFRYYNKDLAAEITKRGRESLQQVVNIVHDTYNLKILFGDTDSVAIQVPSMDIVSEIIANVNKDMRYRELMLDKTFSALLLVGKKRYAAMIGETQREVRGLEAIRKDWSNISKRCSIFVIDTLLQGVIIKRPVAETAKIVREMLESTANQLRNGQLTANLTDYAITKITIKDPKSYDPKDIIGLPHIRAALKLGNVCSKEYISYVMCNGRDSISENASQNPIPIQLVKSIEEIDIDWYISEIATCVSRVYLILPDENMAMQFVRNVLGIHKLVTNNETTKLVSTLRQKSVPNSLWMTVEQELFSRCPPISLKCNQCLLEIPRNMTGLSPVMESLSDGVYANICCPSCHTNLDPKLVADQLNIYLASNKLDPVTIDYVRRCFDINWTSEHFRIPCILSATDRVFFEEVMQLIQK